ncbi:MAG TPA: nitrilase-related carbon-nitrogen hydrolase, partial [Bryobacteraceae bacterium]|nr:nitrilase-related carbon-nitrogen hydrolase [Bryobacteraceae bacterium]
MVRLRIALAQINSTVGDLPGNAQKILDAARRAASRQAELVIFPELALTGYPPRDLVEKESFLDRIEQELAGLADATRDLGLTIICGFVGRSHGELGKSVSNSAAVLEQGKVAFRQDKMLLPTYDVFDEARYFVPAEQQSVFFLRGQPVAITVCEDAWNSSDLVDRRLYHRDPVAELVQAGGQVLVSINASPFHLHKRERRRSFFQAVARRHRVPLIYVNLVGGNDQLIFDGSSFALNSDGEVIASAASFSEDLVLVDLGSGRGDHNDTFPDECEAAYEALVLGCRDYIRKCGFSKVII